MDINSYPPKNKWILTILKVSLKWTRLISCTLKRGNVALQNGSPESVEENPNTEESSTNKWFLFIDSRSNESTKQHIKEFLFNIICI